MRNQKSFALRFFKLNYLIFICFLALFLIFLYYIVFALSKNTTHGIQSFLKFMFLYNFYENIRGILQDNFI